MLIAADIAMGEGGKVEGWGNIFWAPSDGREVGHNVYITFVIMGAIEEGVPWNNRSFWTKFY